MQNVSFVNQRWSRGHKARGQGQGHKKSPRPRTTFPWTDPLEAKDRNARGQGQGQRTQAQVLSKKKRSSKFFSIFSNSLAYPKFLIGGCLNHKSHKMTSSKFFQSGSFCGTKISSDGRSEIGACWHVTRILQRERD